MMDEAALWWCRGVADLLRSSHSTAPSALADTVNRALRPLGVDVWLYLVDREQVALRALPRADRPIPEPLPVETSLAGRAYTTLATVVPPDRSDTLWMPLVDDAERFGVLQAALPTGWSPHDPQVQQGFEIVATMIGHLLVSKSAYGDTIRRARRSRPMSTEGEMLWRSLPPLTCITDRVTVTATLEPSYDVGGDAFDYAIDHENVRIAVLDASGHGLTAALTSTLTLAATRAARAARLDLATTAAAADQAITSQFGELRYATAVLAELDTSSGVVQYVNAGHPPAALIRQGRVVSFLDASPRTPLGIPQPTTLSQQDLQPQDRLLFYTDGITDARDAHGTFLGLDRLVGMAERHSASGLPVSEVCRRLSHAVLDYQDGTLADDATLVIVEWLPGSGDRGGRPPRPAG